MKKQKVTLMMGLPGCGKSTWLKKNAKNAVVISPDSIRKEMLGHQFHQPAEPFIWWLSEAMAKLMLSQGKDIIIDATNLFPYVRGKWADMADVYGAEKEIIWLATSSKKCWDRNVKRAKGDVVPKEAFDRMVGMFREPDSFEIEEHGWKIKKVKQ